MRELIKMKNLLVKVKNLVVRNWKLIAIVAAGALVLKECI